MKAKNYKEVAHRYLIFTVGMVVTVAFFILICGCFIYTTKVEHSRIMTKTIVFDQIHSNQIDVVDRVDSLYTYMALINSDERVNNMALQSVVSSRKMQLLEHLSSMSSSDVRLYSNLMEQMNDFLDIKENIRTLTVQEQLVKGDLQRCINDNKQASRKLIIGGVNK